MKSLLLYVSRHPEILEGHQISFLGSDAMPTLPGFRPSCLDSLPLGGPCLSIPVSLVAPLTTSIRPSESAFQSGLCHFLSLTESVSVPPLSLYMLFCVSLLLVSVSLSLFSTSRSLTFSFSSSLSHSVFKSQPLINSVSDVLYLPLPSCPQSSPEAENSWGTRQSDSQQKPSPVPYQVPNQRQQHHAHCPEGATQDTCHGAVPHIQPFHFWAQGGGQRQEES